MNNSTAKYYYYMRMCSSILGNMDLFCKIDWAMWDRIRWRAGECTEIQKLMWRQGKVVKNWLIRQNSRFFKSGFWSKLKLTKYNYYFHVYYDNNTRIYVIISKYTAKASIIPISSSILVIFFSTRTSILNISTMYITNWKYYSFLGFPQKIQVLLDLVWLS